LGGGRGVKKRKKGERCLATFAVKRLGKRVR